MDLKDFVNSLSKDLKDFVLKLDRIFIEEGLVKNTESKYFRIKNVYSYKGKDLFTIASSINGYCLIIKSNNILNFPNIIENFPLVLQQKISKGFGCYRKTGGDHCEGACQGYRFSLDDSFFPIQKDIELWIDKELSSLKKK